MIKKTIDFRIVWVANSARLVFFRTKYSNYANAWNRKHKQNEMNGLPLKSEDQVTKHKLEPDRRKILSRKFGRVAQIYSIFQPTKKAQLANNQSRCSISKTNLLHCAKNFFRSVLVILTSDHHLRFLGDGRRLCAFIFRVD